MSNEVLEAIKKLDDKYQEGLSGLQKSVEEVQKSTNSVVDKVGALEAKYTEIEAKSVSKEEFEARQADNQKNFETITKGFSRNMNVSTPDAGGDQEGIEEDKKAFYGSLLKGWRAGSVSSLSEEARFVEKAKTVCVQSISEQLKATFSKKKNFELSMEVKSGQFDGQGFAESAIYAPQPQILGFYQRLFETSILRRYVTNVATNQREVGFLIESRKRSLGGEFSPIVSSSTKIEVDPLEGPSFTLEKRKLVEFARSTPLSRTFKDEQENYRIDLLGREIQASSQAAARDWQRRVLYGTGSVSGNEYGVRGIIGGYEKYEVQGADDYKFDMIGEVRTSSVSYNTLVDLSMNTLLDIYADSGAFFMNRKTHAELRKLTDDFGRPLAWNSSDNLSSGANLVVLGRPVVIIHDLPDIPTVSGESAYPIIFGDLRAFVYADRYNDLRFEFKEATENNLISYLNTFMYGTGMVTNFQSYRLLKVTAA